MAGQNSQRGDEWWSISAAAMVAIALMVVMAAFLSLPHRPLRGPRHRSAFEEYGCVLAVPETGTQYLDIADYL